jgi:hypothetical protein
LLITAEATSWYFAWAAAECGLCCMVVLRYDNWTSAG